MNGKIIEFSIDPKAAQVVSRYLSESEVVFQNFIQRQKFVGKVRDTLLGFNLPEKSNKAVLEKAKYIYGDNFKQTDSAGNEVPFFLTVGQALLKNALQNKTVLHAAEQVLNTVDQCINAAACTQAESSAYRSTMRPI